MSKTTVKIPVTQPVEFIPCVLKLDKRKFACYVEEHVNRVPPLHMAANAVKISSKRKKAWRTAVAMAMARARHHRANSPSHAPSGSNLDSSILISNKGGSKSSKNIRL